VRAPASYATIPPPSRPRLQFPGRPMLAASRSRGSSRSTKRTLPIPCAAVCVTRAIWSRHCANAGQPA